MKTDCGMFRLGCSQAFVPPLRIGGRVGISGDARIFSADLERGAAAADPLGDGHRAAGLATQRLGRKPGEMYWLWRDRKGLIANPLGLLANLVFVYGLATRDVDARARRFASHWLVDVHAGSADVCASGGSDGVRRRACMECVFALGVPVRAVYANALNAAATVQGGGALC